MKTLNATFLSLACAAGLWTTLAAQPAEPPAAPPADPPAAQPGRQPAEEPGEPPANEPAPAPTAPPAAPDSAPIPAPDDQPTPPSDLTLPDGARESTPAPEAAPGSDQSPRPPAASDSPSSQPSTGSAPATTSATSTERTPPEPVKSLRLNFRNAPLDLVLNHLSEAAGFIIDLQTDVKGKVDVWSNQTLTPEEAYEVVSNALGRNGYAVIRNGRILTVLSKDDARKRDIPVKVGNLPAGIPKNEEVVTQIVPVRYINATQLIKDLQPLLPSDTTITANEGGNSLVITDTQINIRRMTEIVRALDNAISSVSAVRVFTLQYADAKSLATVLKELFQPQTSTRTTGGGNPMQQFINRMRGGPGGGGDAAGGSTSGGGRVATPAVVAVADERSNSIVVSAPEDQMPIIDDLVRQIDTSVEDITEVRVFHLKYADPQETADLLTSLFPDTSSSGGMRGQFQFGGGRMPGMQMGGRGTTSTDTSARLQKQTKVTAVADARTRSVVVSASRDLLVQIGRMIADLDSDPARKRGVYVFDLENTDPQTVQGILEQLFPDQNYNTAASSRYRTSSQQQTGNQLNTRATRNQQNQGTRNAGGSTSFGTSQSGR